jgi:hypothetical protein
VSVGDLKGSVMKRVIIAAIFVTLANVAIAAPGPSQPPTVIVAGSGTTITQGSPCKGKCTINSTGLGGSVTTSGSPVSGNMAKFTGPTVIGPATAGTDYVAPNGSGAGLTGISASQIGGTVTGQICQTWDSVLTVAAATVEIPIPWASYTITGMKYATNGTGTPSFTAAAAINGTSITGLTSVTVNSSSNTNTSASGTNTGSVNDRVTISISSPSGTPNQAYVCLVVTHTVN